MEKKKKKEVQPTGLCKGPILVLHGILSKAAGLVSVVRFLCSNKARWLKRADGVGGERERAELRAPARLRDGGGRGGGGGGVSARRGAGLRPPPNRRLRGRLGAPSPGPRRPDGVGRTGSECEYGESGLVGRFGD